MGHMFVLHDRGVAVQRVLGSAAIGLRLVWLD